MKIKSILFALFVLIFSTFIAHAYDKPLLDTLVANGILSPSEVTGILKESAVVIPAEKSVKSLRLSGRVQTQYENISVDERVAGVSQNIGTRGDFIMRRVFVGLNADIGGGWSSTVIADLCRHKDGYLEYAYITKEIDNEYINGTLDLGYKKITFNFEEYTSSSSLMSVERSLASRYFSESGNGRRLGLGGRHTGVFLNGKIPHIDGLSYGFSVSNSFNNSPVSIPQNVSNDILFACGFSYKYVFENEVSIILGANFAYADKVNVSSANAFCGGTIVGANPYVKASIYGFDIWSEFLVASLDNANFDNTKNSTPMGVNVGLEYKFDIDNYGKLAPTARFSWIDTDGRGIKMSDGVRDAPSRSIFDKGYSVYVGVNWYIIGNSVKLQVGYEYARLDDSPAGNISQHSQANAFRGQFQFSF